MQQALASCHLELLCLNIGFDATTPTRFDRANLLFLGILLFSLRGVINLGYCAI